MNLTTEQLNEITSMASLFFTIDDIAANIEADPDELKGEIMSKEGDAYTHFMKGRIKTEIELRTSIKQAAMNGSNPAQEQMINFLKQSAL